MVQSPDKELQKLLMVFNPEKLVSTDDITQTLDGIAKLLTHFKSATEGMNAETKRLLDEAFLRFEDIATKSETGMQKSDSAVTGLSKEFTRAVEEVKRLASEVMAMKPENGTDGRDGKDGRDGADGKNGKNGKDGKDGSPDTASDIREKIESLKGEERVDASAIKNLPQMAQQIFRASPGVNRIVAGTGVTISSTQPNGQGEVTISASGGAGAGDVTGPASSTDGNVVLFDGATGKILKDSGLTLAGSNTGDQNLFRTIAVSGQSDVVADTTTDTLTLVAGTNVTIVTNAATDTITISAATSSSGITRSVNVISTPTTAGAAAATDYVYFVSGTTTLTLPTAVSNTNRYTVKNTGANTVTIATTSAQTIDGSASSSLPVANTSLDLISDGANWRVV